MHLGKFLSAFTLRKINFGRPGKDGQTGELIVPSVAIRGNATICSDFGKANAVTSEDGMEGENLHQPVLDLDVPCLFVESTSGKGGHLYIQASVPKDKYRALLVALVDAGLYNKGNLDAFDARGFSTLRLPWHIKHESFGSQNPTEE